MSEKENKIIKSDNDMSSLEMDSQTELNEEILNQLQSITISKNDRILLISSSVDAIGTYLLYNGYTNLFLLCNRKSVYDLPHYTQIKYVYDKDTELHYPGHFFKLIITPYAYFKMNMPYYIENNGAIIILYPKNIALLNNFKSDIQTSLDPGKLAVSFEQRYAIITSTGGASIKPLEKNVDILCYSHRDEGILIHSKLLKSRLENEYSISVKIKHEMDNDPAPFVIIEYHKGLKNEDQLGRDIQNIIQNGSNVILENHSTIGNELYSKLLRIGNKNIIITYRSCEMAIQDKASAYRLLPVLSYKNIPSLKPFTGNPIRIGTFGFFGKQKGLVDLIRLCKRLKVPAILLLGRNPMGSEAVFSNAINTIKNKYKTDKDIKFLDSVDTEIIDLSKINIISGIFSDEQIIGYMAKCSHIAFSHRSRMEESGTIKYAKRLNRPIFALDSFQSRIGQVYRFKKFTRSSPFNVFKDSLVESGLALLRRNKALKEILGEIFDSTVVFFDELFSGKTPTIKDLLSLNAKEIRDDDGIEYLINIMT